MARILVVEDDPQTRKPMARLLLARGYEVAVAADAMVALAACAGCAPDLILLDISIPGLDGLTFLWRLRETAVGRKIPVIVITAHSEEEYVNKAKALGVKEYLVKAAFDPADLMTLIHRYAGVPYPKPEAVDEAEVGAGGSTS